MALSLRMYGPNDTPVTLTAPAVTIAPGAERELAWTIPDLHGAPIIDIGLALSATARADGSLYLDALGWDGTPHVTFSRPPGEGTMWRRAWIDAIDQFDPMWPEAFRIVQNRGPGLLIQGSREWTNYRVRAAITPHLAQAAGVAARVQGLCRYYALTLQQGGTVRLVKLRDGETILAELPFPWELGQSYQFQLEVAGNELRAWVIQDGTPLDEHQPLFTYTDRDHPLTGGAAAFVVHSGCIASDAMHVEPLPSIR